MQAFALVSFAQYFGILQRKKRYIENELIEIVFRCRDIEGLLGD